jgi:phosphate starvation-inducible membrane PsiE
MFILHFLITVLFRQAKNKAATLFNNETLVVSRLSAEIKAYYTIFFSFFDMIPYFFDSDRDFCKKIRGD